MEINSFKDVIGVVTTADVVEGRFGLLTAHTFDHDFGSQTDLPGFKVPATAEEAKNAYYVVTWAQTQQKPPFYEPMPTQPQFSTRGGFGTATNVPFTSKIRLTYPGYQDGETIPSGTSSLAYTDGIFTIASGCYIYNAALKVCGSPVVVANTAEDTTDAGKIKYQSTVDERVIGNVHSYDATTGALTIKVK